MEIDLANYANKEVHCPLTDRVLRPLSCPVTAGCSGCAFSLVASLKERQRPQSVGMSHSTPGAAADVGPQVTVISKWVGDGDDSDGSECSDMSRTSVDTSMSGEAHPAASA